ncbi:DUF2975 domain-containing protein [uncultured Mediterranea sp.]|uniref:DUF2975 domain-containing protein n=1 Tax=uncultured Mediterranea sp. TaxID=1926662 RepID=UPI0027D9367F|nr:DUF2975 domain-containing protein [uncultured Mediterranea sp.]
MKRLKSWYQRYKGMGTLFWVVCIILFSIVCFISVIIDLIQAGGDERLQGWAYVCNLLALVALCVSILRLDCRNLLSHKTADSLDFSGYFIILMMLIRNWIVGRSDALSDSWNYSLDGMTILLFGFLLQFVGKIVRRAVKLKEEQDLTI